MLTRISYRWNAGSASRTSRIAYKTDLNTASSEEKPTMLQAGSIYPTPLAGLNRKARSGDRILGRTGGGWGHDFNLVDRIGFGKNRPRRPPADGRRRTSVIFAQIPYDKKIFTVKENGIKGLNSPNNFFLKEFVDTIISVLSSFL